METQQQHVPMTGVHVLSPRVQRKLTGIEARKLALEALRRAEEARAAFACAEAEAGPDWEKLS
jgi:hypothetical protein